MGKVLDYLNKKNDVHLSVGDFKINPFGTFYANDILIRDHYLDTLIIADKIEGTLEELQSIKNRKLFIKNVNILNAWVNDKTYPQELKSNLSLFTSKFKSKSKNKKEFQLFIDGVNGSNLRYSNKKQDRKVVDFDRISGNLNIFTLKGTDISAKTDSLSFVDIYGIKYRKLKADFDYSLKTMHFKNAYLETESSSIYTDLTFEYNGTEEFTDFVDLVKTKGKVFNSSISLSDVNKIYPHYQEQKTFDIEGEFSGVLNNLSLKNTKLSSSQEQLLLKGDAVLKNTIHNRDSIRIKAKTLELNVIPESLAVLVPDQYKANLPKQFYGINSIDYKGSLEVSIIDFLAKGLVKTNLGVLDVNGKIEDLSSLSKKVDLDIYKGELYKNKKTPGLKLARFRGNVNGFVEKSKFKGAANIAFSKILYKKNSFRNSNLLLNTNDNGLTVELKSKDSLLTFESKLEYNEKETKKYNLVFDIEKAKLSKLFPNLMSYQKTIQGSGNLEIEQDKGHNLVSGKLHDINIETLSDHLKLGDVDVEMDIKPSKKEISLKSKSLFDFKTTGDFEFVDFEKLVNNAFAKFVPIQQERIEIENQSLNFQLELKPKFIKTLTDKLRFNNAVNISGLLQSDKDKCVISASAPSIYTEDITIDSLNLVLDNSNKFLNSNLSIKNVKYKNQVYDQISLLGKKINDTLFVRSNFNTNKIANRAVFYVSSDHKTLTTGIESLYLKYANQTWVNKQEKQNKILFNYETKDWFFKEVSLTNENQEFEFSGGIKSNKNKDLKLRLQNLSLQQFLPQMDSLEIGGIASGEIYFKEKNKLFRPQGHLNINELVINDVNYGLMQADITPNAKEYGYNLGLVMRNSNVHNIDAGGEIIINKENFVNSKIDLDVKLNDLKLNSLSPLGKNILSKIRGSASGLFKVKGSLNDFENYGTVNLKGAGVNFPYLNTDYEFLGNAKVQLKGKGVAFNNVAIQDRIHKTKGKISGEINYNKLKKWSLDLDIDSENLMVMNIPEDPNAKFYGTGFMEGYAKIYGPTSKLSIVVNGKTLKGTNFILPLSDLKEVEENNFIYYAKPSISEKEEDVQEVEEKNTSGLSILLNLDITKDAVGAVVIDQVSGSSLQGSVDGRLVVDIDSYFNINMYGDLVVDEGLYNFKYRGLVNKPFQVKKGGTVSWNGDPYEAELNIEALHRVKANPKVLLDNLSVNRKIDIDLITKVTGELFDSSQEFGIDIPNASSNVKTELDFKINTDKDTQLRQFFSLLVSKSFFDEDTSNTTSSVLTSTTSELISNAVTDIFNKSDDKFQINIGYTSGETNEIEDLNVDDQIDIGLATEINDRILINGSLGVPVGATTQSSVVGEVKVEFLLNEDGTLRTSVFNRQNEIQYSQEEEGYTQGVGLNYQINFNDFSEMIEKLKKNKEKDKK